MKNLSKFLLFRYLDFALFFFAQLFFADTVGPEKYGVLSISLTTISYAPFFLLGTNQYLLRTLVFTENLKVIKQSNFIFLILISAAIGFTLVAANVYVWLVVLIVLTKLFLEYLITILRGLQEPQLLINTFKLSSFLWISFICLGYYESFLYIWPIILSICIVFIFFSLRKKRSEIFTLGVNWIETRKIVKKSISFAIIGMYIPFLTTLDRWFLNNRIEFEQIGNIQLAYNLSNIVTFGLGAISFYIYPFYLKKLKDRTLNVFKFKLITSILAFVGAAIVFLLISELDKLDSISLIFKDYDETISFLKFYIPTRFFIWALLPFNLLIDFYNIQRQYAILVIVLLFLQLIIYLRLTRENNLIEYHAFIQLASVIILFILLNRVILRHEGINRVE